MYRVMRCKKMLSKTQKQIQLYKKITNIWEEAKKDIKKVMFDYEYENQVNSVDFYFSASAKSNLRSDYTNIKDYMNGTFVFTVNDKHK